MRARLISRLDVLGARSFFQVASVVTTVYNIKMTGSSGALYKDSTAVFSWANFELDGASLPTTHGVCKQRLAFSCIELCMHV